MATLYLHVGMPKTGTSAIQRFLINNRKVLNSKGYSFPDFDLKYESISDDRNAYWLNAKVYDPETAEKAMDEICRLSGEYEKIILSDEGLWNNNVGSGKGFYDLPDRCHAAGIQIKAIVYLRSQDEYVFSQWKQNIKQFSGYEFPYYLKRQMKRLGNKGLDYWKSVNRLAEWFGRENVIVKRYQPSDFKEKKMGIVGDFLETVGIELSGDYDSVSNVNLSLGGKCLEAKRLVNDLPEFRKDKHSFLVQRLYKIQEEDGKPGKEEDRPYFTKEQRMQMLDRFREGNSKVAQEFLGMPAGSDLFDMPEYITDEEAAELTAEYSRKELAEVYGRVICDLHAELGEAKQQLEAGEKREKQLKKQLSYLQKAKDPVSYYAGKVKRKLRRMASR